MFISFMIIILINKLKTIDINKLILFIKYMIYIYFKKKIL